MHTVWYHLVAYSLSYSLIESTECSKFLSLSYAFFLNKNTKTCLIFNKLCLGFLWEKNFQLIYWKVAYLCLVRKRSSPRCAVSARQSDCWSSSSYYEKYRTFGCKHTKKIKVNSDGHWKVTIPHSCIKSCLLSCSNFQCASWGTWCTHVCNSMQHRLINSTTMTSSMNRTAERHSSLIKLTQSYWCGKW